MKGNLAELIAAELHRFARSPEAKALNTAIVNSVLLAGRALTAALKTRR